MKLGRWRIVDKFVIPNLDNPDQTYLTRWRLLETPWFGIFEYGWVAAFLRRTAP